MRNEVYQPFLPCTEQVAFTEQLLRKSCLYLAEAETRIYSSKCSFFRAICISAHTHTHKGELTAGLANTGVYLNTANALPANSWKFKAARSQTPLTRVACDKKPHFCISASVC